MVNTLLYFYNCPLDPVFNAFVQAAKQKFGKDCQIKGKSMSFGLNFSFKYNMNGGFVNVYCAPYQNGTAVEIKYTIIQLALARYKAHARDLTNYVNGILQTSATEMQNVNPNIFAGCEQNYQQGYPQQVYPQQNYPQQGYPQQNYPQQSVNVICRCCGNAVSSDAAYCPVCGTFINK